MKVVINAVGGEEFIPVRKEGDSGYDLRADIPEDILLYPGQRVLVPCGIKLEIEEGYEGQVRSRSGLALKNGIKVLNSPGTIDSAYRGILGCILYNSDSKKRFEIHRGDRIAQLVFSKIEVPEIEVQNELSETWRGDGGFGHTGVK